MLQPFPAEARWHRWSIPLYLFFGMFPGAALGAFLVFCDRVLYSSYLQAPPVFSITPLTDQILAGTLMWVLGTFVYLIPAVVITLKLLSPRDLSSQAHSQVLEPHLEKFSSASASPPL